MTQKKQIRSAENNKDIAARNPFDIDFCSWSDEEQEGHEAMREAWEFEEQRTTEKLVKKLAACFEETANHFGPLEAKRCFEAFLESPWVEQKFKLPKRDRRTLSPRDRKFLAEYETAPDGEKWQVIQKFAEDNYLKKGKNCLIPYTGKESRDSQIVKDNQKKRDRAYKNARRILRKAQAKPEGNILRQWLKKS